GAASLERLDGLALVGQSAAKDVVGFGGGVDDRGHTGVGRIECDFAGDAADDVRQDGRGESHYLDSFQILTRSTTAAPVSAAKVVCLWSGVRPCSHASRATTA